MPNGLNNIHTALDSLAAYDGSWTVLRDETDLLAARVAELKERETRLDDLLVVALVGGSGVGKSTLLNAIAGDELAKTSEMRPCTTHPTVYHPPGAQISFPGEWSTVAGSALENLILIDTPDSDTIVETHRERVVEVLRECDLVAVCADSEKYLDDATWALLRPLLGERTMICIETKAARAESVKDHWLERLAGQGFTIDEYFRVDSRRTFDRKLAGASPQDNEFDFTRLEAFLADELSKERIARIKRSNTAGLLRKTLDRLHERVVSREAVLTELQSKLGKHAADSVAEAEAILSRRLFAQSHLWTYALGREVSVRSKGVVATCYRLLEAARTLPARIAMWSPLRNPTSAVGAAALLTDHDLVNSEFSVGTASIEDAYRSAESSVHLDLSQAGFDVSTTSSGYDRYTEQLSESVGAVLRGIARDRIGRSADRLTSWPVTILMDIPPLAFFIYTAYFVVREYFSGTLLPAAYFVHAGSVLGLILFVELFAFATAARGMAWGARRAARSRLHERLAEADVAFIPERAEVERAAAAIEGIRQVRSQLD